MFRRMTSPTCFAYQNGASLVVTLLIVLMLTLLGVYGAGILVLETRSAANDFRARQALAAAESGVEQGLSFLNANRARISSAGLHASSDHSSTPVLTWTTCSGAVAQCQPISAADRANWRYLTLSASLMTQPEQGTFQTYVLTPVSGAGSRLVFYVVALGASADGTGQAVVKQGAYFFPVLIGAVNTPLAAANNVDLSGNYSIITNSNGGGSGVAVSAWSANTLTPGGSFASCHSGDFSTSGGGGACPSSKALSQKGVSGSDLVGNDPGFPPDLFEYLFGVPASQHQVIKDQATVVPNCSGLGATSSGIIWVTGDCNPPANVGSPTSPVLLVVEGDARFNASSQAYGLLYMFNPSSAVSPKLIANGNAHLHGAIFAHKGVELQLNGGFVLGYDQAVLNNLKSSPATRALTRVSGAWSDNPLGL